MQTYHNVDDKLRLSFTREYTLLCERLAKIVAQHPADKRLPKLQNFFIKAKSALQRHRYRVAEWKNRMEKVSLLYGDLPAVQKIIFELTQLFSQILTATKRQN
jgi:hypothetical protein